MAPSGYVIRMVVFEPTSFSNPATGASFSLNPEDKSTSNTNGLRLCTGFSGAHYNGLCLYSNQSSNQCNNNSFFFWNNNWFVLACQISSAKLEERKLFQPTINQIFYFNNNLPYNNIILVDLGSQGLVEQNASVANNNTFLTTYTTGENDKTWLQKRISCTAREWNIF